MQIKDYFDFLAPDDIRLRSSRIAIESGLCSDSAAHRRIEARAEGIWAEAA